MINIGNTYLEAANNYKSASGTLGYLRPESIVSHTVKTKELLLTLHDEAVYNQNDPGKTGNYLYQNYPNPFNDMTRIGFRLVEPVKARIVVYNSFGIIVRSVELGNTEAGSYHIDFTAKGLSSGLYYYSLFANDMLVGTRKMMIE